MLRREFLGWDRPWLEALVEWLWVRRGELAGKVLVVPTAQSGRRLREALAERGAVLAPRVVTPAVLIRTEGAASETLEVLAWQEVLEAVEDWGRYEAAFPVAPGEGQGRGWALGLAKSLALLRRSLQEAGMTIRVAAKKLKGIPEADRWEVLAVLEEKTDRLLEEWGWMSRSLMLASMRVDPVDGDVWVAGVPDLSTIAAAAIERSGREATILVAAPESEEEMFDGWGRPVTGWTKRRIDWPEVGSVELTADARQQARRVREKLAAAGTASDEASLGCLDRTTAGELVKALGEGGWKVHDPMHAGGSWLRDLLRRLAAWVEKGDLTAAMNVLGHPGAEAWVGGIRAKRVEVMARAMDRWMVRSEEEVRRCRELAREDLRGDLDLVLETLERLERLRSMLRDRGVPRGLGGILERVKDPEREMDFVHAWLEQTGTVAAKVRRSPAEWLRLLESALPLPALEPEEGRVLDVVGWMELFYERGRHLVVAGMNEGLVPEREAENAWLSEPAKRELGLRTGEDRAARDAYLLTVYLESRREGGRVDLLLAKGSASGEVLQPSRLLLQAEGEELARRVQILFCEVEPADAGLAWSLEARWKWRIGEIREIERFNVTMFSDYLACPFRFYLKHGMRLRRAEPERIEWHARDFGNVMHEVLEAWGRDEEAREYSKAEELEEWLAAELERWLERRYGRGYPVAIGIQVEAMRQRLGWFARVQACERAAGWRMVEVEKPLEWKMAGVTLVGRIDRIERHEDGRLRVLDYKTGGGSVEEAHRRPVRSGSAIPAHVEGVEEVLHDVNGKEFRWTGLQVPLYAIGMGEEVEVGYFALGSKPDEVRISCWEGFGEEEKRSAERCAEWVIGQVKRGVFWPPAERVTYDDYALLAAGRTLEETVAWEGGAA